MKKVLVFLACVLAAGAARAEGDAAKGETVFKKCAACHTVGPEAKTKVGPVLNGLFGRTAGSEPEFEQKYSKAMKEAGSGGLVWTPETVEEYLEAPKEFLKGNKMAFVGVKKEEERENVIAYLLQFSPDYKPAE